MDCMWMQHGKMQAQCAKPPLPPSFTPLPPLYAYVLAIGGQLPAMPGITHYSCSHWHHSKAATIHECRQ